MSSTLSISNELLHARDATHTRGQETHTRVEISADARERSRYGVHHSRSVFVWEKWHTREPQTAQTGVNVVNVVAMRLHVQRTGVIH